MGEPTDEQLVRTLVALRVPPGAARMAVEPRWRERALELHNTLQRAVNGDPSAAAVIATFKEAMEVAEYGPHAASQDNLVAAVMLDEDAALDETQQPTEEDRT